ncbi:hypothetical protein JHK82_015904 [Glycine max]|nr:hypothetical protein JHK82_015904 [Glycine max]
MKKRLFFFSEEEKWLSATMRSTTLPRSSMPFSAKSEKPFEEDFDEMVMSVRPKNNEPSVIKLQSLPLVLHNNDLFWEGKELVSLTAKEGEIHLCFHGVVANGALEGPRVEAVNWISKVCGHYGVVAESNRHGYHIPRVVGGGGEEDEAVSDEDRLNREVAGEEGGVAAEEKVVEGWVGREGSHVAEMGSKVWNWMVEEEWEWERMAWLWRIGVVVVVEEEEEFFVNICVLRFASRRFVDFFLFVLDLRMEPMDIVGKAKEDASLPKADHPTSI